MKRKIQIIIFPLSAALILSGCQSRTDKEAETDRQVLETEQLTEEMDVSEDMSEDLSEYFDEAFEFAFEEETEEAPDPVDLTSYKIDKLEDHVTLGNLSGISATEYVRTVTDEDVQAFIEEELATCAVEEEVDRPVQEGDIVYADVTSVVPGINGTQGPDTYYMHIGNADISSSFDKAVTGMSAGDQKDIAVTFGDSAWSEDWCGKKVKFHITVTAVMEESVPEYNDTYVSEYTEYGTTEEYESAIRQKLEHEYAYISKQDVYEDLMRYAQSNSVYSVLPVDFVRQCKEEIVHGYLQFLGEGSDIKDITEVFGYTEAQMAADAEPIAQRRLLAQAVCDKYNLSFTQEEYFDYLAEQAEFSGGITRREYEETNTRSAAVWGFFENKASEYLYSIAKINQVPYTEKPDDLEMEVQEDGTEATFS